MCRRLGREAWGPGSGLAQGLMRVLQRRDWGQQRTQEEQQPHALTLVVAMGLPMEAATGDWGQQRKREEPQPHAVPVLVALALTMEAAGVVMGSAGRMGWSAGARAASGTRMGCWQEEERTGPRARTGALCCRLCAALGRCACCTQ